MAELIKQVNNTDHVSLMNFFRRRGIVSQFLSRFRRTAVETEKGEVIHWSGEMNSPGVLKAAGWTKNTLKEGDQVTITLHPSKAGAPVGTVDRSKPILANGKQVFAAGGNGEQ